MKRIASTLIALTIVAVVLAAAPSPAALATPAPSLGVGVTIDGLPLTFPVPLQREDYRVLVPFRAISEAIGVTVDWIQAERGIVARQTVATGASASGVASGTPDAAATTTEVRLWIDRPVAVVNGVEQLLDVPPRLVGDKTFLPARFFATVFGCGVDWDEAGQRVLIKTPERTMTIYGFYALGSSKSSSWTDLYGLPYPAVDLTVGAQRMLSTVGYGWYNVGAQGVLRADNPLPGWSKPSGWETVLPTADLAGLRDEMVVYADDGQGSLRTLLPNPDARATLEQRLGAEVVAFDGVNLDWESLGAGAAAADVAAIREAYAIFCESVAAQLHAIGKQLTVTVPAPNSIYAPAYDYARLGAAADRLIVMAYDYYDRALPSPMAPLAKVEAAVTALLPQVPAAKLVLGIAPGGVEWRTAPTTSRANPLAAADVASLTARFAPVWDEATGANHFTYQDAAGSSYSIWLEDDRSIALKLAIAKRYGLGGVAFWRLGEVPTAVWNVVDAATEPLRVPATPVMPPTPTQP